MQDQELFKMCVSSFNTWVKPKVGLVISILELPVIDILFLYHACDLALCVFFKLQLETPPCL